MNNKWKIFFGVINEEQLIEAKIKWGLNREFEVSICEGHHPLYTKVNEKGLSIDKTTEILESYADQITYTPLGSVSHQAVLRDTAYKNLSQDPGICIMSDVDEFYLDKDLEEIDHLFSHDPVLKLVLTNSYIFLDNEHCAPHIQRKQGNPIKFDQNHEIYHGEWHERIFRYNKYYGYKISPFLINDLVGRSIFNNPAYYGQRILRDDIYMLHYKNFKRKEAEERHQMYEKRGDKEDYNKEWIELEENKILYKGEHSKEIMEVLK